MSENLAFFRNKCEFIHDRFFVVNEELEKRGKLHENWKMFKDDFDKIDMEKLSEYGQIVEVKTEDILN